METVQQEQVDALMARTWLSRQQAAALLGVSSERVSQWARGGLLRYQQTALGRLYDPASVAEFQAEREARSAARSEAVSDAAGQG